jgi:hypothetical protein
MDTINSDLIYKKKYLKYKNKYINEKNKLYGGLTFKNGLYAFFCDEAYAKSQGINYEENKDAPSIFDLNNKLSLNGYRVENNSKELSLIISKMLSIQNGFSEITDSLNFVGKVLINSIIVAPVVLVYNTSLDYSEVKKFIMANGKEDIKQKNNNLPAKITLDSQLQLDSQLTVEYLKKINIIINYIKKKFIDINCCIIIEVNPVKKNKYKKIIRFTPPIPPVEKQR